MQNVGDVAQLDEAREVVLLEGVVADREQVADLGVVAEAVLGG